jgi:hypothetical protein
MRETPPPPRRIVVEVAVLRAIEEYLGDPPQRDKRAADLHERITVILNAEGLL